MLKADAQPVSHPGVPVRRLSVVHPMDCIGQRMSWDLIVFLSRHLFKSFLLDMLAQPHWAMPTVPSSPGVLLSIKRGLGQFFQWHMFLHFLHVLIFIWSLKPCAEYGKFSRFLPLKNTFKPTFCIQFPGLLRPEIVSAAEDSWRLQTSQAKGIIS